MSPETILDVIRAKAEVHPELYRQLTYDDLRTILAREDVGLLEGRIHRPAQLMQFWGEWAIVLNRDVPRRRHLDYATHELGHLWLHHDPASERWERVYNMSNWLGPDPREDDADLFCTIVLGAIRYV